MQNLPPLSVKRALTIVGVCVAVVLVISIVNYWGDAREREQSGFAVPMMEGDGGRAIMGKGMAEPSAPGAYSNVADRSVVFEQILPTPLPSSAPQGAERKIVRTAALDLLVKDTGAAAQGVRMIADTFGGMRGNENFYVYAQGLRQGTISIWVPAERFDEALQAIRALALRVNSESVTAQDVSAQHVDLTARLTNMRAAEEQYRDILTRSGSIEEVLSVTQQLVQVRGEIESLQSTLAELSSQVALSSITVSLTPEATLVSPGEALSEWRPGTVAKAAYQELRIHLMRVGDGLITFLIVGVPLLLIILVKLLFFGVIVWVAYRIGRNVYERVRVVERVEQKEVVPPSKPRTRKEVLS